MKKPSYPFAVVEWADAHATLDELSMDDIRRMHKPSVIHTNGYILLDDVAGLWVASEWLPGDPETWRGNSFVPRGMVIKVTYRTRKKAKREVVLPVPSA